MRIKCYHKSCLKFYQERLSRPCLRGAFPLKHLYGFKLHRSLLMYADLSWYLVAVDQALILQCNSMLWVRTVRASNTSEKPDYAGALGPCNYWDSVWGKKKKTLIVTLFNFKINIAEKSQCAFNRVSFIRHCGQCGKALHLFARKLPLQTGLE